MTDLLVYYTQDLSMLYMSKQKILISKSVQYNVQHEKAF